MNSRTITCASPEGLEKSEFMKHQYIFLVFLLSLLSGSGHEQSSKTGGVQNMQNHPSDTEHSTISNSETKIGYLEIGQGPGLILAEAAFGTAYNLAN
jgi:hypothetical protein